MTTPGDMTESAEAPLRSAGPGQGQVVLLSQPGPERLAFERELDRAGVPLPLTSRTVWAQHHPNAESWFIGVRGPAGDPIGGFAASVLPTRALPGHRALLVERFGDGLDPTTYSAGVAELRRLAEGPRIIRVIVEVFVRNTERRAEIAATLSAQGFAHRPDGRTYARTVGVDLRQDETKIFAGLHATARQNIRAAAKHPVTVSPIRDVALASQMQALVRETMGRTGGAVPATDWHRRIALANAEPRLYRIVGLFRRDSENCDNLIAFAVAASHGSYATYEAAASTRRSGLKIPLGYALAWDLMCWARGLGLEWFDFGGITTEEDGHTARLRGVSAFKRYFAREVRTVGEEWALTHKPRRARLVDGIRRLVGRSTPIG